MNQNEHIEIGWKAAYLRKPNRSDLKAHSYPSNLLKFHNSGWAISESIFGGESKGIGILEVGEKPIAAAFLELGIVERSSHEGHSRSYVHESDLLPEPEFLGLEDLSADVKGGGVYPTDQQLIFAEPLLQDLTLKP